MLAAVEGGQVLGFIAGKLDDDLPGGWYLDTLHVDGLTRGKGVGTALIRALVHHARDPGYGPMSVCRETMPPNGSTSTWAQSLTKSSPLPFPGSLPSLKNFSGLT